MGEVAAGGKFGEFLIEAAHKSRVVNDLYVFAHEPLRPARQLGRALAVTRHVSQRNTDNLVAAAGGNVVDIATLAAVTMGLI